MRKEEKWGRRREEVEDRGSRGSEERDGGRAADRRATCRETETHVKGTAAFY